MSPLTIGCRPEFHVGIGEAFGRLPRAGWRQIQRENNSILNSATILSEPATTVEEPWLTTSVETSSQNGDRRSSEPRNASAHQLL